MRSRYAAYALGLGDYLVKTLAVDHPDLALDADVLTRELSRQKDRQRFLGLTVLAASTEGAQGEVTFFARIFEQGRDCSFTERSKFIREEGGWRYAGGDRVATSPVSG